MLVDGLDYIKTVEKNRLVFKGQNVQKINSYFFLLVISGCGLYFSYNICISQLSGVATSTDYIIAFIFPLIILLLVGSECRNLLYRDQLKEIKINKNSANARNKLLEAAKNLGWRPDNISDHYFIFNTKYHFLGETQCVTLIFFPDNKIFFNSINYPNDYIRPSRFMNNYQSLVNEYLKIEKE